MEEDRYAVDPHLGSSLSLLHSRQRQVILVFGFCLTQISSTGIGNIG